MARRLLVAATSVFYFALPASVAVLIVTAAAGVGSLIFSDLALGRLAGEER